MTEYVDLIYLMSHYYGEVSQRGTRKVFKPKDNISKVGIKAVDGEYLRLIAYNILDEFTFNLNRNKHIGWNIGNSSPLYKGTEDRLNLNKYYVDYIDDVHHIHQLSIGDSSLPFVSIVADHDLDDESVSLSESGESAESISASDSHSESQNPDFDFDKVVKIITPGDNNPQGLGKGDKRIIINPHLDYEVTMFIKATGGGSGPEVQATLDFGPTPSAGGNPGPFTATYTFTTPGFPHLNFHYETDVPKATIALALAYVAARINSNIPPFAYGFTSSADGSLLTAPPGYGDTPNGPFPAGWIVTQAIQSTFDAQTFNRVNYTFMGGVDPGSGPMPTFSFGVDCWDKNDNIVQTSNISTFVDDNTFLEQEELNQPERYYFVRGILYNKNTYKNYSSSKIYLVDNIVKYSGNYYKAIREVPINKNPITYTEYWILITASEIAASLKTNIGKGNNLLLNDTIVKVDPFILYDDMNSSDKNLYIYDIRVQILRTDYSKGFVQTTNLLELWNTNNNQMLSEQQVNNTTRHYLIPANTALKNNFIDSEINS